MLKAAAATAATLFVLGSSAVFAADGAATYKARCASCHGADGKADTPAAKAMKAPALAGNAEVEKMSADDVAKKIAENPKHPGPVKSLGADDVKAAAAFVKQLK